MCGVFFDLKAIHHEKTMTEPYLDLVGTHRAQTTTQTLDKLAKIRAQIGITRLANVTGLDSIGIPVYIAIRPNAKHISVAQGKGSSADLAKVSALMESVEQWHAENIPKPDLIGSYQNLIAQNLPLVDPTSIAKGAYAVEPLVSWPLHWYEAMEWVQQRKIYIPFEAISLDSTVPSKAALLFQTSTNGLASGNTRAEAIVHALCEVIERDAYYKWHQRSQAEQLAKLLDNATIDSMICQMLLEKLAASGTDVKIWDITSNLGIPTFLCAIMDSSITRGTQVFAGKGTHLDKAIALSRAITEAVQVRLTFITGSRDDVFPSYYQQQILSRPDFPQGTYSYEAITQPKYDRDFDKNVTFLIETLCNDGYEQVVVVDHTRPEINIPVVHVVVPHLNMKIEA